MTGQTAQDQDGGWLRRLRAGDECAFAEFVDKYKEMVFLCCRTLGLREDQADDVAGEVFLAAYKGIGRYKGRARLSTWLWRIAYNKAVSYLRKINRGGELRDELAEQFADMKTPGPSVQVEAGEIDKLVWQAVEKLPRLWAMAVVLYYREGKRVREIAKIMQTKQNTVKTYLFRSRQRLKRTLGPVFGDESDVSR